MKERPESVLDKASRIGALLFMKLILEEFPHYSANGPSILLQQRQESLSTIDTAITTGLMRQWLIWLLVIGAAHSKRHHITPSCFVEQLAGADVEDLRVDGQRRHAEKKRRDWRRTANVENIRPAGSHWENRSLAASGWCFWVETKILWFEAFGGKQVLGLTTNGSLHLHTQYLHTHINIDSDTNYSCISWILAKPNPYQTHVVWQGKSGDTSGGIRTN